jgi:hypothetical protein
MGHGLRETNLIWKVCAERGQKNKDNKEATKIIRSK